MASGSPLATGARERNVLLTAFVVSLLLHVLGVALTWRLPLAPVDLPERRAAAEEVELILVPDEPVADAPAEDPAMPTAYTSVPERSASETPPEKADYLALHHSLAADNKLGDGDRPSADIEDEIEQVAIQREDLSGAGGVAYAPTPVYEDPRAAARSESAPAGEKQDARTGEDRGRLGEDVLPTEQAESSGEAGQAEPSETEAETQTGDLAEWWSGQAPSVLREGDQGAVGDRGFDFNQDSRGNITSGVAVEAPYSLNTYQWAFAPWMNRFVNELRRHWQAPYAYQLGVIDGKTQIRLVVEKNGRASSMEVMETEGHESLHKASLAALHAFAPYAPLPADFPEENLVITLTLFYPAWRR